MVDLLLYTELIADTGVVGDDVLGSLMRFLYSASDS